VKVVPRYVANFELARLPQEKTDVLIIGSGIAGLYLALKLSGRCRVMLVTKDDPQACATDLAQGGIAAAVGNGDAAALHFGDTLAAGGGLSDPAAASLLAQDAPDRVRELIAWGIPFDREGKKLALGQEGAHSRRRILHAGGDATGAVIWQGLVARASAAETISILPHTMALDLLVAEGRCYGALVLRPEGSLAAILASATVLASGGAGRLYAVTTNPAVATGDGIAMAYRAGAEVMDLEFYQFHPTALVHPRAPGFLISEAVRGEGAVLRNKAGERFMPAYHPLAELAPRDVVARAMAQEMARLASACVFLDLTHLDRDLVERRFPTIASTCRELGFDLRRDWLPVAPAAHYLMGGVRTDLWGQTSIRNLYACGEVACTGAHGANRLAGNSLLEGLVFSARIADAILGRPWQAIPCPPLAFGGLREDGPAAEETGAAVPEIMHRRVGLIRDAKGLKEAADELERFWPLLEVAAQQARPVEARDMLLLARLMVEAAAWRRESRGAHHRSDFPKTDPTYRKRLILARGKGAREIPVGPEGVSPP
jgi:L-aspartate oxidase